MKYIVTQISNNETSLTFSRIEGTKKTQNAQGMDMTISGENKITGEMIFYSKTGIIKQKKSDIEGKGNFSVMNQVMPFTKKQTIISKSI